MGSTSLYMLKKAITLLDDLHHRNTHNPYKTINILERIFTGLLYLP